MHDKEELLRLFIEHAPSALAMFDREMRYLLASRRWLRDYGLEKCELAGLSHYEVFPEIPEVWREAHRRGLSGEILRSESDCFKRADGSIQWLRWEIYPWNDATGQIGGIIIFTEDITSLICAQEQTKKTALFPEENPFPVLRVNGDGVVMFANRASNSLLTKWGCQRGELVPEFVHCEIKAALEAEKNCELEVTCGERNISLELVPITREGYVNLYGRDLTDRKRMEESLLTAHQAMVREQNFLKAVFDALPVGICITDEHGGVIRTNNMDEKIWGARPATGGINDYHEYKAWWADTGKPVQPEEWASARAVTEGETVLDQVLEIKRFDGTRGFIHNSAAPVRDSNEKIIGSAVSIQDVTRQWESAKELSAAKIAAEEASRAKSDFLANMSHEIRTPLTVFMVSIEHLMQIERNPEHRQLLELAKQSSKRLHALVNDILDFSKIEARHVDIVDDWFNLRDCLKECVELMATKVQEKNLTLEFIVSDSVPEKIVGDQFRIEQVLINLIDNAIKFTNSGGVKVVVEHHDGSLKFAVKDSGIGITDDMQEKIFENFSQVDSSSTRQHGGTGLGLAISKGLVELMGGTINVQSKLGKGSVFTLKLPIKILQSKKPTSSKETLGALNTINDTHILLVEDDPMVQKIVQLALSQRSWHTVIAETGREAVNKWIEGHFDLILMDLQMPDMDGIKATLEIRRLEEYRDKKVSIIGLTAHATPAIGKECIDAGMNRVLVKPFNINRLYEEIECYLPT
jgi:PAS domain S-box-containing protein